MISSEALKKALSKPSCISISSTAKPMPPLERKRRGLFATRLRQASGTKPAGGQKRRRGCSAVDANTPLSEEFGRIGSPQAAQREQRRDRCHDEGGEEYCRKT